MIEIIVSLCLLLVLAIVAVGSYEAGRATLRKRVMWEFFRLENWVRDDPNVMVVSPGGRAVAKPLTAQAVLVELQYSRDVLTKR